MRLRATLIAIPGHEAPSLIPSTPIPEALYRVTLQLVDTRTGVADAPLPPPAWPRSRARCRPWPSCIVAADAGRLPPDRKVRIGVAGVLPMDDNAASRRSTPTALDAAVQVLDAAGGNVTVVGLEETQRLIARRGTRSTTSSSIRGRPRHQGRGLRPDGFGDVVRAELRRDGAARVQACSDLPPRAVSRDPPRLA